ncbi:MAG: gliding motility-associated C-terminal domain-containing protein [Flavobacteriales bacterium]|nr:gliding motility-associated C-terminal domain-containing protein [Flavobacteriales bacterium]
MRNLKALLFTAIATLIGSTATASHISGGEITWQCLGGNQYQITMNLYRDCVGIGMSSSYPMSITSPCGNVNVTLNQQSFTEISQLCPSDLGNSACNGGPLPGMQAYVYTGVVTLPPCDFWTFSWNTCCRNDAIDNLVNPGSLNTFLTATLNNADFPCDNSPVFNNVPIPYVCLNQPVTYSFGVSEVDGDSLSYAFIPALDGIGIPVPYVGGYSATSPIPGITIDPVTGLITFTPTATGNYVVTVLVTQYDDAGNIIGTIMRDIQFVVIPCTNQSPDPTTGTIANFSGSATQTGPYSVQMCETDNFCFDFTIVDPDAGQTLTLISNVTAVLPGATFTYSGTNPVSGTICWTSIPTYSGVFPFIITAIDDACPVSAFQTYVYGIQVLTRTTAGPDQTLCGTQVANLQANGGSTFTWSVLSGDPMNIGVNFSCNPCSNPIAQPSVTTTYAVVSDLSGACLNGDTVTVFVVPNFSFQATQSDDVLCLGESVQFNVTVNPSAPGYTFSWSPTTGLSDPTIPNPTGSYTQPGVINYIVSITSPDGCYQQDSSLVVTISPAYPPDIIVSQLDYFICQGESTQFIVELDNTLPSFCGLNPAGCSGGVITQLDLGTGTQSGTTTSFPSIYGQFYTGVRNQMLIRASELYALGFVGGTINEIAFNVANIPAGANTTFHEFEIKMGCTTLNELAVGPWVTGLNVVFPAQTIQAALGWNTYQFNTSFNWDGVSNLIVEVCTDNYQTAGGSSWTQNSANFFTPTTYNSVHEWHSDQGMICSDTPTGFPIESVSTDRPNMRFKYCSGINEDLISYVWTPPIGLSDPTIANPVVTPVGSPAIYTVTVGDPTAGCVTTATFEVNWYPNAQVSFIPQPNEGVAPMDVYFNNTSAGNVSNFQWFFGDGNDSTGVTSPNYVYNVPGVYYVTLNGYDVNGCFGTYTDSVVVLDQPFVEIPNVFSPNGDGQNDAFTFIDFRGFRTFTMKVFNRWGMLIHEARSVSTGNQIWRPASDIPDGTYYYEFVGQGSNGDTITKTGHVTLLR